MSKYLIFYYDKIQMCATVDNQVIDPCIIIAQVTSGQLVTYHIHIPLHYFEVNPRHQIISPVKLSAYVI